MDLDKIKEVRADYVDVYYCIVPDEAYAFGLYGCTTQLKQYIKDSGWKFSDDKYFAKEYCEASVSRYMKNYETASLGVFRGLFDEYIFAAY